MAKKPKKLKKAAAAVKTGSGVFAPVALSFAANASKNVKFTCSSGLCVVTIVVGLLKARFVSKGQMLLPPGSYQINVAVDGPAGAAFSLSATGAKMAPLNANAPISGVLPITV